MVKAAGECTCGGVIGAPSDTVNARRCLFCHYLRHAPRITEAESWERNGSPIFRWVRLEAVDRSKVYTLAGWCRCFEGDYIRTMSRISAGWPVLAALVGIKGESRYVAIRRAALYDPSHLELFCFVGGSAVDKAEDLPEELLISLPSTSSSDTDGGGFESLAAESGLGSPLVLGPEAVPPATELYKRYTLDELRSAVAAAEEAEKGREAEIWSAAMVEIRHRMDAMLDAVPWHRSVCTDMAPSNHGGCARCWLLQYQQTLERAVYTGCPRPPLAVDIAIRRELAANHV